MLLNNFQQHYGITDPYHWFSITEWFYNLPRQEFFNLIHKFQTCLVDEKPRQGTAIRVHRL